ncbi:MAG TPA: FoF1 ATP synthase subunit gamma [Stellaceae bacterium]|nr:FoF1 ATP synthase subunit gamma [Stellaceae bacterium]
MTRLAEVQGRIGSMTELMDVVGAMRSLAGMRAQEAERTLPGVRRYAGSMGEAIGTACRLVSSDSAGDAAGCARQALVLYMAEHGFVGGFNERLMDSAQAALAPGDALLVMGSRGAAALLERGRTIAWWTPMAARPAGAPAAVGRLTTELYARIARRELMRVDVMFGRYRQGSPPEIARSQVLPVDTAALAGPQNRPLPLHNLAPQVLLERLMAEYVFARLTEAAVESIASENAARFAAMEQAHGNVGRKLDALKQQARQARQEEITTELLDLVSGSELLAERRMAAHPDHSTESAD